MHEVLDFLFNEWLVGFGVPILISAGFAFIGDEFRAFKWARICFVTSAAWICGKTLMWSVFSLDSFRSKAVVVFFACGFVGVALLAVLVLTTKREAEVAATPEKMQVGKKPSVVMTAYLQPTEEPYSQGMAVGGIVWSRNYMDVRLDIVNGPVEIKDLDFYVQLTDTSIAGIGQISQLQGMTVLPANEFPAVWLAGTDTKGQPESIPIVPTPGLMRSSPVYRVHCSEIFANAVTHLVIASVALNPTENGHLPQQLFAPRRAPKAISVKGNYDTQKAGGGVENHPIEFWYSFQQITEGSRAGAVEQLSPAERPYVIAETATFIDDDNKVRVEFHNSGKTPAVDLGLSIRFLIGRRR